MEEPNAEPIARAAREPRHPSLNTSLLSAASHEHTMVDYLKNHPQGFSEMPFNSVDSLILSTLSYLDLDSYPYEDVLGGDGVPVVDIVRFSEFESFLNGGWISASKELPAFVKTLLRCRRFADLSVRYFVQEDAAAIEKQFCACTFSFGGKTPLYYLAFRGTDGTLAGWKEDFNLSYRKVIPSQRSAERYVSGVLSATPKAETLPNSPQPRSTRRATRESNASSTTTDQASSILPLPASRSSISRTSWTKRSRNRPSSE